MRQELLKLDCFKVASALQILLSRFGHRNDAVRETIEMVLSKLASEYPSQCAWWIFHFHFFDAQSNAGNRKITTKCNQAITRAEFSKNLIKRIMMKSEAASQKIMECETIFGDLKKLTER